MKYRVKLKTTVTAWVEVEIQGRPDIDMPGMPNWAADDAVELHSGQLRDRLTAAGLDHGPIELAHEELDQSVEVVGTPAARTPCPEGFRWIGQSFAHCDKCGLPAWEHDGMSSARRPESPWSDLPDDEFWVLKPWAPGQREACRRKWDPGYAEVS